MNAARREQIRGLSRVGAALAFLALVLQLLFPAGFMADTSGGHRSIPIVICTGQGPLVADWPSPADHGSKKSPAKPMGGCPFAGHGTASAPPAPILAAAAVAFEPWIALPFASSASPGLGLAAPPPPAIGPPLQA